MQVVVELLGGLLVLLLPGFDVLLESHAFLRDFLPEIALVVEILFSHLVAVFLQVLVFDHVLVLFGLLVDLAQGGSQLGTVVLEGDLILGYLAGLSDVVPASCYLF